MKRMLAALAAAALVGCQGGSSGELTVYAAASLREAFEDLADAYADSTGVDLVLSFDASSALRTQIAEGAPADVFASADLANAQALVDEGLTDGDLAVFARNALTIVVPADAAGVDDWIDLATPRLRIIAAGEDVPITRYATELIANLSAQADAPEAFADAYAANVVSREDNVRAVLAKIEVGEGDAAIVYETDAASTDAVTAIEVPADANVLAEYAVVTVSDAAPGAADFVAWLLDDPAQGTLESHGFRRAD
jgi:molybdate transport system substrate-binding protein